MQKNDGNNGFRRKNELDLRERERCDETKLSLRLMRTMTTTRLSFVKTASFDEVAEEAETVGFDGIVLVELGFVV